MNQGVRGKVDSSGCNLQGDSLSFSSRSQSKVPRFSMVYGSIVLWSPPPPFLILWQGVLADKVILGHLGPGLITQDLVVFQVNKLIFRRTILGMVIHMKYDKNVLCITITFWKYNI